MAHHDDETHDPVERQERDQLPSSCIEDYDAQLSYTSLIDGRDASTGIWATVMGPGQPTDFTAQTGAWASEDHEGEVGTRTAHNRNSDLGRCDFEDILRDNISSESQLQATASCPANATQDSAPPGPLLSENSSPIRSGLERTEAGAFLSARDVQRPLAPKQTASRTVQASSATQSQRSTDIAQSDKVLIDRIRVNAIADEAQLVIHCTVALCHKTFKRVYEFKRHLDDVHSESPVRYKCLNCTFTKPRKDKTRTHARKCHKTSNGSASVSDDELFTEISVLDMRSGSSSASNSSINDTPTTDS